MLSFESWPIEISSTSRSILKNATLFSEKFNLCLFNQLNFLFLKGKKPLVGPFTKPKLHFLETGWGAAKTNVVEEKLAIRSLFKLF